MNAKKIDTAQPAQSGQSAVVASAAMGPSRDPAWRQRYALLAKQPFFEGLSPAQIEELTEETLEMRFATGEQIVREGDPANRFFLILEGKVELESEGEDRTMIPIQTLGPGEDLGWSWLFAPFYFHFSARAIEPTRVIFFYGTRLRERCEQDHDLGYQLMKRIAHVMLQRLQATRKQLSQRVSDDFTQSIREH
jgi:CRP/FNR family cyclic AMP-dependent transcriptional regulator